MKKTGRQQKILILMMLLISVGIVMNASFAADSINAPVLLGSLSGDHLNPKPLSVGQGKIIFKLSGDGNKLYYQLSVESAEKPTAAYIYMASDGEKGRAVVSLFDLNEFPRIGSFDGNTSEGVITAEQLIGPLVGSSINVLMREMEQGNTFVSVITKEYPEGYIKGQIVATGSLDQQ